VFIAPKLVSKAKSKLLTKNQRMDKKETRKLNMKNKTRKKKIKTKTKKKTKIKKT
tara:strand:- start:113 stop:277 length:165 start_codon:yes stop_codon:yes gene_type:complete